MPISRRLFLARSGSLALLSSAATVLSPLTASEVTPSPQQPADSFPGASAEVVHEVVLVSHFNLTRLKDLVLRQPALARAAFDWGFGDWESALGAASHMGNREIAEFLIGQGARPDLFTAAMFGHLEVVKAWVASRPGIQRLKGPHGLTLLAHAKAGGEVSRPVVQYLEALGDADPLVATQPLTEEERTAVLGRYRFGPGARDIWSVQYAKELLTIQRADMMGRPLNHLGHRVFSPWGADAVRISFTSESPAVRLTVSDPDPLTVGVRQSS
jgi:hypothetical protein